MRRQDEGAAGLSGLKAQRCADQGTRGCSRLKPGQLTDGGTRQGGEGLKSKAVEGLRIDNEDGEDDSWAGRDAWKWVGLPNKG